MSTEDRRWERVRERTRTGLRPVERQLRPSALRRRVQRWRDRWWLITQAAIGAALAWWVASDLLGHPLPFFAPVTAMVCLGLTYDNRVRRVIELTVGVAIGVLVADVFVHYFGSGVWQLFAVAAVAMSLAVLAGAGQLLMLQAGIQGVIVTTLVAGEGQAFARWLDAVVGGLVALTIAVLAPSPRAVHRPAERAAKVTTELGHILTDTAQGLTTRDHPRVARALRRARALQGDLDDLREAAAEGLAVARLTPLRRRHRSGVQVILDLLTPLDLAIRNVRVLVRRAEVALHDDEFVPPSYIDMVASLGQAASHIGQELAEEHAPVDAREDLVAVARRSTWRDRRAQLSAEVMRAQVRSAVVDLLILTGMSGEEARVRVPPTRDDLDPGPEEYEEDEDE